MSTDERAPEHWLQVTLPTDESPDWRLLVEVVGPWIDDLRESLVSWHYFWEPDLWVRLRFATEAQRDAAEAGLRADLDPALGRLENYDWAADAELMGAEMWSTCQRDFQNGAELGLRHARQRLAGGVTKDAEFHWTRHVHTFSNQLVGAWADEARLTARLSRYRIWLLSRGRPNAGARRSALEALLPALDAIEAALPLLRESEAALTDAWRAAGRPPMRDLLELPDDFDAQRAREAVADS